MSNTVSPPAEPGGYLCYLLWPSETRAECSVAHTHIGVNPTWRPADWSHPGEGAYDPDPTDNNQLWFFSLPPIHPSATPGWPNWTQSNGSPFLVLTPLLEGDTYIFKPGDPNKVLYVCSFTYTKSGGYRDPNGLQHLDGWHSAHGPQGAWDLESIDANTAPPWDSYIRRQTVSANLEEDDFFMLLPNDTPVLENNGDVYALTKRWLADMNAWGMHEHMCFYFWLDASDEAVSVALSAHDAGGLYQRSADTTFIFARTVIQPIAGDLNGDGIVDEEDIDILMDHWGQSGIYRGDEHEPDDHDHDHDHASSTGEPEGQS
jgi:hypothetical protein